MSILHALRQEDPTGGPRQSRRVRRGFVAALAAGSLVASAATFLPELTPAASASGLTDDISPYLGTSSSSMPATEIPGSDLPVAMATQTVAGVPYVYAAVNNLKAVVRINETSDEEEVVAGGGSGTAANGAAATGVSLNPVGVAVDSAGNVFFADSLTSTVYVAPAASGTLLGQSVTAGDIYAVAGNGTLGNTGNTGPATSAEIKTSNPTGIVVDTNDDLYLSGGNGLQLVPSSTGTFFGATRSGGHIYNLDSSVVSGEFGIDSSGNALVAVTGNASIDVIPAANCASSCPYGQPSLTAATPQAIAGTGVAGDNGTNGPATSAQISTNDVTVDSSGNVLFTDSSFHDVRMVAAGTTNPYGSGSTTADDVYALAGTTGSSGSSGDGGLATSAKIGTPTYLAVDQSGDLLIDDWSNSRIRAVLSSAGVTADAYAVTSPSANDIYTVAGGGTTPSANGDDGLASDAYLANIAGMTADSAGGLYVGAIDHRIRFVPATSGTYFGRAMTGGDVYTIAGTGTTGWTGSGLGTSAAIGVASGLVVDASGNLLFADETNNRVALVADEACPSSCPYGLASTVAGDVYTIAGTGTAASGALSNVAATSANITAQALALDAAGDVIIGGGDYIDVLAATGGTLYGQTVSADDISTIAGTGSSTFGGDNGPATSASGFIGISVAVDPSGNILTGDSARIRMIAAASSTTPYNMTSPTTEGDIYTIAGTGSGGYSGDGGAFAGASSTVAFSSVPRLSFDSAGDLFVQDWNNNVVRFVPEASGTDFGVSMTAGDIYTIAGNTQSSGGVEYGTATDQPINLYTAAGSPSGDVFLEDQEPTGNFQLLEVGPSVTAPPSTPNIVAASGIGVAVGSSPSVVIDTTGFPTPAITESGTLPAGVTLTDNANGTATLAGTPAVGSEGDYSVNVYATNSSGSAAVHHVRVFVGTSSGSPNLAATVSGSTLLGSSFSATITADGVPLPTISATGSLPSGVTLADNGDGTATLSGTPVGSAGGVFPITISASNGLGSPATEVFTLAVDQAPSITSASHAAFTTGSLGSFTVGSTGTPTPSLSETGSLPSGVRLTDNGDGTATLSGTPAAGTAGSYPVTVAATNGIGSDALQTFTLTVSPAGDTSTSSGSNGLATGSGGTAVGTSPPAKDQAVAPSIAGGTVAALGGFKPTTVPVKVSCSSSSCTKVSLKLMQQRIEVVSKRVRQGRKVVTKKVRKTVDVVLGTATADVTSGSRQVKIGLNKTGRTLLAAAAKARRIVPLEVQAIADGKRSTVVVHVAPPRKGRS